MNTNRGNLGYVVMSKNISAFNLHLAITIDAFEGHFRLFGLDV